MKEEKDIRASLYQQFVSLDLPSGSNLEIDIDDAKKGRKKDHLARVAVKTSRGVVFSMSFSPYKYESIISAREELKSKLKLWADYEHLHSGDLREHFVDSIIEKRYLH